MKPQSALQPHRGAQLRLHIARMSRGRKGCRKEVSTQISMGSSSMGRRLGKEQKLISEHPESESSFLLCVD